MDPVARLEPAGAAASHVEQDATADHAIARVGDVVANRSLGADVRGVVAVVDLFLEVVVRQRVPLRPDCSGRMSRSSVPRIHRSRPP
jgi:hypothetical protein